MASPGARIVRDRASPYRCALPRPLWVRLATINALIAGTVLMGVPAIDQSANAAFVRQAAQIELVHAMGTIACLTLVNVGAIGAARAPIFFIVGTLLYCAPVYLGWPHHAGFALTRLVGSISLVLGWIILTWAAGRIDRPVADMAIDRTETADDHDHQLRGEPMVTIGSAASRMV